MRKYFPAMIVLVALFGATAYWIDRDEQAEEQGTVLDITNLSSALAEHVGRTLRQADQLATVLQIEAKKGHSRDLIKSLVAAKAIENDVFLQVSIADRRGNVVETSSAEAPLVNLADRQHFIVHKSGDARSLYISKPVIGRISGKWSIQLSKRLETENGQFDGVVVVSIDPDYFTNFYKVLDIGDRGVVAVIGLDDNIFRARHSRFDSKPGQILPQTAMLFQELHKSYRGNFAAVSPIDGQARHYAYRLVDNFPLVVLVGVDDEDMMAASKIRASVFLATVGTLALLIIAFEVLRIVSVGKLEHAARSEQLARKQQEKEKDRLQKLFQTMPDGVLVLDSNGKIASANDNACNLLGASKADLDGVDIGEVGGRLFPSNSAIDVQRKEDFASKIRAVTPGEISYFNIVQSKSSPKVLQFCTSPLKGVNEDKIVVIRDITSENQLNQMKSEFVSTAAHQLKTPLASIFGFSELLIAEKVPESSKRQVYGVIHGQAKQLTVLLSDLLDLARIEARANNTADRRDCSISYLLEKAKEYNPSICTRIDIISKDCEVIVNGDEKLIIQAIYNLFDNAAKYSQPDSIISVRTRVATDGTSVSVDVADVGIGMTPQDLVKAFQRFFRANPESAVPGTGLGLSFVKEVAEMHGGSVSIASHIGIGTCVTLRLPARNISI